MNRLVVIEGLDGSGKATQSALLEDALRSMGYAPRRLSFPNYESPSSALVKLYLDGFFGSRPGDVNAYAASSFYAVDRYASFKADWQAHFEAGGVLVADRYTTSNAIHQCVKLPEDEWDDFVDWLWDFEYGKLGLPQPGLVLFLDVEPAVSRKLLAAREKRDVKATRDIHEEDGEYLERCRKAALWCAEKFGWKSVKCTERDAMRPAGDIAAEILKIAGEIL